LAHDNTRAGCHTVFLLFLVPLLIGTGAAMAVESTILEVRREGEAYELYAEMVVDAPIKKAYALLSDYDRLDRLSDIVIESVLLASPAKNRHRVYSLAEMCVLLFCARVTHVQDVYEMPHREILALTVPAESDLKEGVLHWRLRPVGRATLLSAFVRIVPDFRAPPLIGPWAIKRALTGQVQKTAENIERLAANTTSGSDKGDEGIIN
jgi:hypothetical protein